MATMQPPHGRAIPIAELHLMQNWIGGEGAAAICAACQEMASLQLLDLSKNRIGQAGADAVAALLQAQTGLRVLRLGNCELGDRASAGERPFPHFVRPF
jgi:Ran GTPase-activating protein (RanGAP) involved in mRNA processing and transport